METFVTARKIQAPITCTFNLISAIAITRFMPYWFTIEQQEFPVLIMVTLQDDLGIMKFESVMYQIILKRILYVGAVQEFLVLTMMALQDDLGIMKFALETYQIILKRMLYVGAARLNRHVTPDAAEKRTLLVAFYKVHNPDQVDQVDSIMEAYTLEAIQATCLERYNADPFEVPPAVPTAAMAPDAAEKRTLLVAFYKVHNPGQVDQVDSIMEAYTLEAIQAACLERYNADPFKPLPTI
eukprot:gene21682-26077_t